MDTELKQAFFEHIAELRKTLICCVAVLLIGFVLVFGFFQETLMDILLKSLQRGDIRRRTHSDIVIGAGIIIRILIENGCGGAIPGILPWLGLAALIKIRYCETKMGSIAGHELTVKGIAPAPLRCKVVAVGVNHHCFCALNIPGVKNIVCDCAPTLQHLSLIAVKLHEAVIKMACLKL